MVENVWDPVFQRGRLSRHLTLVSLEMGTRRQALMGCTAISLREEAAPLERNRTGCDGGMDGYRRWGGRGGWQTGTAGPGHAQKPPLPILCASQASIVVILISTSEKTLFCRTRGVILQPLPSSSTEEPSNLDANYLSFTCRAKQTAKWQRKLQYRTAGGQELAWRRQHEHFRIWNCSNEERKLWWCCGFSPPCKY